MGNDLNQQTLYDKPEQNRLPHIGQRITKTAIAVFLCLLIYDLRGYRGQSMPAEAMITAIICMQPYIRDSRTYAFNRLTGTLVGAGWGLVFLLIMMTLPNVSSRQPLVYAGMAIGVLACLYSAVLIRKPDTAGLSAIVFLCVVVSFPDIEAPFRNAMLRIVDVLIGTFVAIGVNIFHLPRIKQSNKVFFVRTKDLAPDRFSQIPAVALFRLNYLYDDGAKICLMSEHAPAFFLMQMNATKLNVPMIVMDGAAIYDAEQNRYLQTETLDPEDTIRLMERLKELDISSFVYTVHNNKTSIFHLGQIRDTERTVFQRMKRSPYRDYLDGEVFELSEVVYIKVIDSAEKIIDAEYHLRKTMPKSKLRAVIRPQAGAPGISGLYIYAHTATMEQAEKRVMQMLREEEEDLESVDVRLRTPYQSERDAMHVLYQIEKEYEPVCLLPFSKKQ